MEGNSGSFIFRTHGWLRNQWASPHFHLYQLANYEIGVSEVKIMVFCRCNQRSCLLEMLFSSILAKWMEVNGYTVSSVSCVHIACKLHAKRALFRRMNTDTERRRQRSAEEHYQHGTLHSFNSIALFVHDKRNGRSECVLCACQKKSGEFSLF